MSVPNAQPIYPKFVTRADVSQPVEVPSRGLQSWLQQQAVRIQALKKSYLLAHALDGVIWGEARQGVLRLSQSQYTPGVDDDTLQEARLFSDSAELHIWRSQGNWQGTLIRAAQADETPDFIESIDEPQMLWGDQIEARHTDFSVMTDGIQGLNHAVPLDVPDPTPDQATERNAKQYKIRPLRLIVRHYLAHEDVARIATSRLVDLKIT